MDIEQYLSYRKQSFIESFVVSKTPDWKCSSCTEGGLIIDESMFIFQESDQSIANRDHEAWEIEWIEFNFIGSLTCSQCKENTFFTGVGSVVDFQDPESGEHEPEEIFTPKYFQPPINIFSIPEGCPDSVKEMLLQSFSVAWANFSGAASLLRVAIERLMEEIAPELDGTLGNKINSYAEENEVTGELLKAVKWLGNTGSHQGDVVEHELAAAYKIFDLALMSLYCNEAEEIADIARLINEAKGPVR